MKSYSAAFNTFVLCALVLDARRKSPHLSLIPTASHCNEQTRDREATPDNIPLSHSLSVTLHTHLSHLDDFIPVGLTEVQSKMSVTMSVRHHRVEFWCSTLGFRWMWLSGWCYSSFCARYWWMLPVRWDMYTWNLLQHWRKLHLRVSWRLPDLCLRAHMSR